MKEKGHFHAFRNNGQLMGVAFFPPNKMVIIMINWIKKYFVIETKTKAGGPKCSSCGLRATKYLLMEFRSFEMEEIDEKILIKLCDGCSTDLYNKYNQDWIPFPVTKEE
jgi:hypothetical protein